MPILSIAEQVDKYNADLRRQMKEQDQRKFRDPDVDRALARIYVLYVWRNMPRRGHPLWMVWALAGFARLKPTPKRVMCWRKRLRIKPDEMVRVLELQTAQRTGPGSAPVRLTPVVRERAPAPITLTPAQQRELNWMARRPEKRRCRTVMYKRLRALRLVEQDTGLITPYGMGFAKLPKPRAVKAKRHRKVRSRVDHSVCDYGTGMTSRTRCTHRAPWFVSYRTERGGVHRVLKHRCTKHAWNDKYFPGHASEFVRVERTPANWKVDT